MANLKTDSPLSRRIARAFLDFLHSVEPAEGVDMESLEVARECLSEVFKLNCPSTDVPTLEPGVLVNIFRSLEANEQQRNDEVNIFHSLEANEQQRNDEVNIFRSLEANEQQRNDEPRTSSGSAPKSSDSTPRTQAEISMQEPYTDGQSKDELCGQFFAALEKIHFFRTRSDGSDDPVQLDKATSLFHDAIGEMEKAGCQLYNRQSLAEALKSQGNRVMQSKEYPKAVELYTCAIALSENNAVYYCNRAAAYTQLLKCTEAIRDCLKAIEIDPNYIKAYSRLGLAYYAQGNYRDAIEKGFKKALQLDPNNEAVKENIRVAEQKLREQQQRTEWDQNTSSRGNTSQEFNNQTSGGSAPPPFSMPFNGSMNPGDIASMFMNMASAMGGQSTERQGRDGNVGAQERNQQSGGPTNQGTTPPQFSMPFGANINPSDIASMFMNMASQAQTPTTGGQSAERQGRDENVGGDGSTMPEIRLGGNINLNMADSMPEGLGGALRSVMEMFSGGASTSPPQGSNPHNPNGQPPTD